MAQIIDKIRENRNILRGMARNGVGTRWYIYLDMYDDYMRLCNEGHKQAFLMSYLCEQYRMSQSQLYRILAHLKDDWKD